MQRSQVKVSYEDGKWRILEDFAIYHKGCKIIVPAGFKTDLASIPRVLWAVFPPFGVYEEAAVVHDYLYKTKKVKRNVADAIFLAEMKEYGTGFTTRWILYLGVRLFGALFYYFT